MAPKNSGNKKAASPTTFYETVPPGNHKDNDRMAMVTVLVMIKDIIKNYRMAFEDAIAETQKEGETPTTSALSTLLAIVESYDTFSEEWLRLFIRIFQNELEGQNVPESEINAKRCRVLENGWLPKLRAALWDNLIPIPDTIHELPKDYAILNFGHSFFSKDFANQHWYPYQFGTTSVWTEKDDPCQWQMFLSSPEPFQSLKAFSTKNLLYHKLPKPLGGQPITGPNKATLDSWKKWVGRWEEAREDWRDTYSSRHGERIVYKAPKRPKHTEHGYKFSPTTHYIKCPACDYIAILSDTIDITRVATLRTVTPGKALWLPKGDGPGYKLNLDEIEFLPDFKSKHPYKWMKKHLKTCEAAKRTGTPECFGRTRKCNPITR